MSRVVFEESRLFINPHWLHLRIGCGSNAFVQPNTIFVTKFSHLSVHICHSARPFDGNDIADRIQLGNTIFIVYGPNDCVFAKLRANNFSDCNNSMEFIVNMDGGSLAAATETGLSSVRYMKYQF